LPEIFDLYVTFLLKIRSHAAIFRIDFAHSLAVCEYLAPNITIYGVSPLNQNCPNLEPEIWKEFYVSEGQRYGIASPDEETLKNFNDAIKSSQVSSKIYIYIFNL
jgi:hypothetical protein